MTAASNSQSSRCCPKCQAEGKGQIPLYQAETWGGGTKPDSMPQEPFHEINYTCPNCGGVF